MTREFTSGGAYVRVTGDLTSGALCPGVYMYMLRLMSGAFALGVFSSGTGRFMSGGLRHGSRRLHQLPQSSLRVGWYRLYLASLSAGFCTRSLRSGGRLFQEAYKRGLICVGSFALGASVREGYVRGSYVWEFRSRRLLP